MRSSRTPSLRRCDEHSNPAWKKLSNEGGNMFLNACGIWMLRGVSPSNARVADIVSLWPLEPPLGAVPGGGLGEALPGLDARMPQAQRRRAARIDDPIVVREIGRAVDSELGL